MPGSGKSTWVKRQLKENDLYISRDEIRFKLVKDTDNYFSKETEVFNTFVDKIRKGLKDNKTKRIFADATHINEKSRKKLLNNIINNLHQEFITNVIWMRTPLEICLERNNKREGREKVPENRIKDMYTSLTMPKSEEGIYKVYLVNYIDETINIMYLNSEDGNDFRY